MAPTPRGAQRAWRAACPNCGAPVEFASAASASAVCSFCSSTLVRDGETLARIGVSGELFDDHSPLQRGVRGRYRGAPFTLVGRLQYGTAGGTWNEWHALFDEADGATGAPRSGWLSEDNGAYVFAFDAPWTPDAPPDAPSARALQPGQPATVGGQRYAVASIVDARLIAAEGELPQAPRLSGSFVVVDLRNAQGEVATLDYQHEGRPQRSVGRSVLLGELALDGLKASSEKALSGRAFECPNCGAAMAVQLSSTQSLTCGQCRTVVDVSKGIGAALALFQQNAVGEGGLEPLIPLGKTGTLLLGTKEPEPWQVVGYLERCTIPDPNDDEDDEQAFWREYLLYHRTHGFAFLVDSEEDGWSWVRPLTGVPDAQGRNMANWRGVGYRRGATYAAKVTWALGEFYWRVKRDDRAEVTDYRGIGSDAAQVLSREATRGEVVWSAGRSLDAAAVAKAFGMSATAEAAFRRDASPLAAGQASGWSPGKVLLLIVLVLTVLALLAMCSGDRCDDMRQTFGAQSAEYQQCLRASSSGSSGGAGRVGGGSWGGYSSGGGGHK